MGYLWQLVCKDKYELQRSRRLFGVWRSQVFLVYLPGSERMMPSIVLRAYVERRVNDDKYAPGPSVRDLPIDLRAILQFGQPESESHRAYTLDVLAQRAVTPEVIFTANQDQFDPRSALEMKYLLWLWSEQVGYRPRIACPQQPKSIADVLEFEQKRRAKSKRLHG